MEWLKLPLAHAPLNRNANVRGDEKLVSTLLTQPHTAIIAVYDRHIAMPQSSAWQEQLTWLTSDDVPQHLRDHADTIWVYLGLHNEKHMLALVVPTTIEGRDTDQWREHFEWVTLRDLIEQTDHSEAEAAVSAVALANWHATSLYCSRCGGFTRIIEAGWSRQCENCMTQHFPRTDAAVIMAVLDDHDRILLGNSAKWPSNRYSTLAGFVEPGESIEDAVRREVHEEAAILVGQVTYFASQPWPFPASLMLGFFAQAQSTDITVDEHEIRQARWFSREELRQAVHDGDVTLPGRISIARALIEHWLAGGASHNVQT
ncbi:NAD(+) diphosphatase [Timonella sp. A28]|uniref:NAD(+) diphosphatase n=1 Tax=Timonella sp. A28 TaxID=3442640 RepID=UPI003EBB9A90